MELQCGHKANSDLDIFCPKCGKIFFAQKTYLPYLGLVGILMLFYYWRPIPFYDILAPLFWAVTWLFFVCLLRNRQPELSKVLMLTIPSMIFWSIYADSFPEYLQAAKEIVLVLVSIVIFIPITSAISLGFKDAVKLDGINKGSYWVVLSILVSLGITILYLIFPFLIGLSKSEGLNNILEKIYNFLGFINTYRSALVAIVVGLATVISISVSFVRELKVKSIAQKELDENLSNSAQDVISNLLKLFVGSFIGGIRTAGDLAKQILEIIFEEVFTIFKDTFYRSILILLRLLRTASIIFLSVLLYKMLTNIVEYTEILWYSDTFWTMSVLHWLWLLCSSLFFVLLLWALSITAYSIWEQFPEDSPSLSHVFSSFWGNWKDSQVSIKSITVSSFLYCFYFSLAFLGAWLFINPVHYLFQFSYPNPIGFLFSLFVLAIIVAGIYNYFFE